MDSMQGEISQDLSATLSSEREGIPAIRLRRWAATAKLNFVFLLVSLARVEGMIVLWNLGYLYVVQSEGIYIEQAECYQAVDGVMAENPILSVSA